MEHDKRDERRGFMRDTMRKLSIHMPRTEASFQSKLAQYEAEIKELQERVRLIEHESHALLRNLERTVGQYEALRRKYQQAMEQLEQGRRQNERLVAALQEAKEHINSLKKEVEKLCAPPNSYAVFRQRNKDGTLDVILDGRHLKVNVHPKLENVEFEEGQLLVLNESLNVVDLSDYETRGEVVRLKDRLDERRAVVVGRADEERVVTLTERMRHMRLDVGDHLLLETRSNYILEKLPKSKVEEVVLEEVPDVTYDDIGGLDEQIERLRDGIELPYLYPEEFREHRLRPPKGILLYGPPGCGKTMIAKAVANSLAKKLAERHGVEARGYFLNIKGPELLNKYVGETESKIREIFKKAREKANETTPVIVFFDEMDALFRVRGSGISSDVEITIVAQFLSELDGLESLENVIVIGASNRQDLIDPAVLRPGRLDLKIKVDRPNKEAARDIFSKYLVPELPIHPEVLQRFDGDRQRAVAWLIDQTCEHMYSEREENKFLEVTYAKGDREIFYFKDFASGAMIENIVARAKKRALKRYLATGEKGIKLEDLLEAVQVEFKENEDLPNTTNPDDWARISGTKGERIINIRPLIGSKAPMKPPIEDITPGQYL
ncbi:MAG: proteasome-associated ATPase [Candidatus Tectimicrobiota bacterium]|nr:MAG: proteasome-associated ATPase [Candidatus Tectomicrobia bacterium]